MNTTVQRPKKRRKGESHAADAVIPVPATEVVFGDSGVVIRAYEFSIWMVYGAVLFFFFTSERGQFNKFVADERGIGIIFGFSRVREGRAELSCAVQYLAAG